MLNNCFYLFIYFFTKSHNSRNIAVEVIPIIVSLLNAKEKGHGICEYVIKHILSLIYEN